MLRGAWETIQLPLDFLFPLLCSVTYPTLGQLCVVKWRTIWKTWPLSSVNFHAASLAFCVALHYYKIISFSLFFCCCTYVVDWNVWFSPGSCKLGTREWSQYSNSGKFCWLQRTKSISSTDTVNFTVFSVNTQHCFSCSTQLSHCTLFPPTAESLFYELAVEHSGSLSAKELDISLWR